LNDELRVELYSLFEGQVLFWPLQYSNGSHVPRLDLQTVEEEFFVSAGHTPEVVQYSAESHSPTACLHIVDEGSAG
jgi:hypothetical protein